MRGFTLIEMLLSVALLALIAGIGVPVYQSVSLQNDLQVTTQYVVEGARRAQTLAQASSGDSAWGVAIGTSTVTVFRGSSYATRNTAYDEYSEVPQSVTPSGTMEFVFAPFTGLTTAGTTTLTSVRTTTSEIGITAYGTITY